MILRYLFRLICFFAALIHLVLFLIRLWISVLIAASAASADWAEEHSLKNQSRHSIRHHFRTYRDSIWSGFPL